MEEKKLTRRGVQVALAAFVLALVWSLPVLADDGVAVTGNEALFWPTVLAWLVPVGLGLLACGAVSAGHVVPVIRTGWLALGIAVIGYWLCGFAFQFGGLGFVVDHPDYAGLVREWTWAPLDATWGAQWGVLGLEGYLLRGPASTPSALALFFAQLPWITTGVAVPLWSLQGRTRPFFLFLGGVLVAFVYTLLGNWTWGGGWLANLGLNLGLGHGLIDLTGASTVHLAGAAMAFAGMLAFGTRAQARRVEQLALPTLDVVAGDPRFRIAEDGETYVPMPPLHLPLLATLGAWLALIGSLGWALSTPARIVNGFDLSWAKVGIGTLLAAAGGAMVALGYSWLTTGQGNALMTARGTVGATIAVGAGLPFVPFWAALAIGAGAGLLVPLVQYVIEHILRLDDPTSAVATHGMSSLWGLLAVGLFADGRAGAGWNRVAGEGVAGYLAAAWPAQFQAQVTGAIAVGLAAFLLSWLLFAAIQGLTRAWQGEYTIRLPRRGRVRRPHRRKLAWHGPRFHFVREDRQEPKPLPENKRKSAASRLRTWFASTRAWGRRAGEKVSALFKRKAQAGELGGEPTTAEGAPTTVDERPSTAED
jgi:Amt family ammonium transporter